MSKLKNAISSRKAKKASDRQVLTNEVPMPIPHISPSTRWRTMPYEITQRFADFRGGFEASAEEYINAAHADMYNAHYYDEIIDGELKIGLAELALQKVEHGRSLHNIRQYQKTSLLELDNSISRLEAALNKLKEESE